MTRNERIKRSLNKGPNGAVLVGLTENSHLLCERYVSKRRGQMKETEYRCKAVSIEGLVQQVTLSYLRHGYFYYVTGALKPQQNPEEIDAHIIEKYDIKKCWRFRASQKAAGLANLQYIRHENFYLIMATEGEHRFKQHERKSLRHVRDVPILVPIAAKPRQTKMKKKKNHLNSVRVFEGYKISYKRGRYDRKTPEERAEYQRQWKLWKEKKMQGQRISKPPKGTLKVAWHPTVSIEDESFERLRNYFLTYALNWKREKLELEFRTVPYVPYWMVKRQLFRILREVNEVRKTAGKDQLPFSVVNKLKRDQVFPFGRPEAEREKQAAA